METMTDFAARVLARTGVPLASLPVLTEMPPIGGHIFCRRGDTLVVGVGYPYEDEDGTEIWGEFAVVVLR